MKPRRKTKAECALIRVRRALNRHILRPVSVPPCYDCPGAPTDSSCEECGRKSEVPPALLQAACNISFSECPDCVLQGKCQRYREYMRAEA